MRYASFGVIAAIVALCLAFSRIRPRPTLFLQCGVSGFVFMVFTPGFAVQYLAWLVPWVVAAGVVPALVWYSVSGVFLFGVYTYWSEQFPWYYANSLKMRDWGGNIILTEVGAWLASIAVLVMLLRRLDQRADARQPRAPGREGVDQPAMTADRPR